VVVPQQVEDAVDQQRVEPGGEPLVTGSRLRGGGVDRDHDVAEKARGGDTTGEPRGEAVARAHAACLASVCLLVQWKREHVGRSVHAAVGAIEHPHRRIVDQGDTQFAAVEPKRTLQLPCTRSQVSAPWRAPGCAAGEHDSHVRIVWITTSLTGARPMTPADAPRWA